MDSDYGSVACLARLESLEANTACWPLGLETGVPLFDEQHHLTDRVLLSLYQTLQGNGPCRDLPARIDQLLCLLDEHFSTEEAVMETCAYPYLGPHRAEHEVLTERIRALHRVYTEPNAPPLGEMFLRVRKMLLLHVQHVDRDYAEHLQKALGLRPLPTL